MNIVFKNNVLNISMIIGAFIHIFRDFGVLTSYGPVKVIRKSAI